MSLQASGKTVRIEICGGIASGKTTLATQFEKISIPAIYEDFKSNPLWRLFYSDPQRYAFATEITFLLQHYTQVDDQHDVSDRFVLDSSLLQDRAYAAVNLREGQLDAFLAVFGEVQRSLPPPRLLVHLRCSAEQELIRVQERARTEEQTIEISYLDALNKAISNCVDDIRQSIEVIEIDSEANDFAHDPETQNRIVQEILARLG